MRVETMRQALAGVLDPMLMENIVDLGYVFGVATGTNSRVIVSMTFPTPHHPHAQEIAQGVREAILTLPGVASVDVQLVSDPQHPWTPYRMAGPLKAVLGLPDEEPPLPGAGPQPTGPRQWWSRLARRRGD